MIDLEQRNKIMIVDDNITNLTAAKKALEKDYSIIPVVSGVKAIDFLQRVTPTLILLDIDMPGLDGFETIKIIKSNEKTKDIPIIFLTAKDDTGSELEGLTLGAVDYITKPFSIPLLLQRVRIHVELVRQQKELIHYNENLSEMVKEQTEVIYELQQAIIHTLTELIEHRDGVTGAHVSRTKKYFQVLIEALQKSGYYQDDFLELDINALSESAPLHDIGKIAIPDTILKKPGKLTKKEFEEIKKHTLIGAEAIKNAMHMTRSKDFLRSAETVVISHHEKWDGSGYPYGLAGNNIPIGGRVMAIVDVYDALVSERPYKRAYSHEEATEIILSESGKHFDPTMIETFIEVSDQFYDITQLH